MRDFPLPPVTDRLRKLFRYGLSLPSISQRTGVPENQLAALQRRGLVEKPRSTKSRYYCNHDFFHVIDTEAKTTDLVILDARNFEGEPQASIRIPHIVPPGFHGAWLQDAR